MRGPDSARCLMRANTDSTSSTNPHLYERPIQIHCLYMIQKFCLRLYPDAKYILAYRGNSVDLGQPLMLLIWPQRLLTRQCPRRESSAHPPLIQPVRPPSLLPLPLYMYHLVRRHLCLPSQKCQAQRWALDPSDLGLRGIPHGRKVIYNLRIPPKFLPVLALSLRSSLFRRAAPVSSHHLESWPTHPLDLPAETSPIPMPISTNLHHRVGLLRTLRF